MSKLKDVVKQMAQVPKPQIEQAKEITKVGKLKQVTAEIPSSQIKENINITPAKSGTDPKAQGKTPSITM